MVPLASVADVQVASVPNEITRENGSRRIDVTCNVRGRDLGAVARDVQARLGTLAFERGYAVLIQLREIMESTDR
jgi:Cu/Ag efflux pump CusA